MKVFLLASLTILPVSSIQMMIRQNFDVSDNFIDWNLCNSTVHSNLGNMGPDSGAAEIRFSSVANVSGKAIDLVMTNTTEYLPKDTTNNGVKKCFGVLNVLSPSSVTLSFRLVYEGTDELVTEVISSLFSLYDIDQSKKGMQESITFENAVVGYWLTSTSELAMSGSTEVGLTFTSTATGNGADNPSNPVSLTQEQRDRAVTVEYIGSSEYAVTFSAIGDASKAPGGRNFMFAGKSDLPEYAEYTEYNDCDAGSCEVWADPHLSGFDNLAKGPLWLMGGRVSTFDRQPLDVNAYETGDFWLVKSAVVHIQARYKLSDEFDGNRSAVGALAVGGLFIRGSKLIIEPKTGVVEWNGEQLRENSKFELGDASVPVALEFSTSSQDQGSALSEVGVHLPLGIFLRVRRYNTHLDLKITARRNLGAVDGQCGNFNGDAKDDLLDDIEGRMQGLTVAPGDLLFSS